MTDVTELRELLVRIESAARPDGELDKAISKALLGEPSMSPLTRSIDCAVSLCERVLPGWRIRWQHDGDGVNHAFVENKGDFGAICAMETESFCATAGLAVCATIIRAQIAMIEKELV